MAGQHHRLDGVDDLPAMGPVEFEDGDVGARARLEAAEIGPLQRIRAADGRGVVIILGAHRADIAGHGAGEDHAGLHVQHHVRRRGIRAHGDVQAHGAIAAEMVDAVAVPARDERAMHDARAGIADDLEIAAGTVDQAAAGDDGAMRQQAALVEEAEALQPFRRAHAVLGEDEVVLDLRLAAMEPDGNVELARGGGRAAQQLGRRGLDAVRREHGADQPAGFALMALREVDGRVEFGEAALLLVIGDDAAVALDDLIAGAIGRAEIGAHAEIGSRFRRVLEFLHRLAPGAVEQRGDRQRGGDAVADQLGEGIALLEGQFLARIHLVRAGLEIAARPDAALLPGRLVVIAEDGGVEVGERVAIDEARPDQGMAVIDATGDFARETMADEDDLAVLEHHFAVLVEAMAAVLVSDDPARGHQDAAFGPLLGLQAHGAVLTETPSRATILPRLITRRLGERVTTISVRLWPGMMTRSAILPSVRP